MLVHSGFLMMQAAMACGQGLSAINTMIMTDVSYWITIPNIGTFIKNITDGRKELKGLFKSKRRRHDGGGSVGESASGCGIFPYRSLYRAEIMKKRLRRSALGMQWHLLDLLGSDVLIEDNTRAGGLSILTVVH